MNSYPDQVDASLLLTMAARLVHCNYFVRLARPGGYMNELESSTCNLQGIREVLRYERSLRV